MAAEDEMWISSSPDIPAPELPTPGQLGMDRAQVARMYDYYLGGKDNYKVDREAAEAAIAASPRAKTGARINRHFLHLGIEHLAREKGIDQYLDIGTGIPTQPNTHQIAQYHIPHARVLYTDNDPIVLEHAEALMASSREGRVDYLDADLRTPEKILTHKCLAGDAPVLDLTRPVALCLVAIFHFILDEDEPVKLLRTLTEPLASGSWLLLSHGTADFDESLNALSDAYNKRNLNFQLRSENAVLDLVNAAGWDIQEPGIQCLNQWWPGRPAHLAPIPLYTEEESPLYGLLARKP